MVHNLTAEVQGRLVTLWVPGPLPSLNQLLGGKLRDRIRLKKQWMDVVQCLAARLKPIPGPVTMRYDFFERRGGQGRDPLNILAGAAKVIEDALVTKGILKGDHQGIIKGIVLGPIIHRPERPGVLVTLQELATE